MLENIWRHSRGSIPPLRMPSLLPHDLCYEWNVSRRLPAIKQALLFFSFNIMPMLCRRIVDSQCCACPQCTAARYRYNIFTVYLYCIFELFTIRDREECQASGPCELYISDTLFCVHKERNLRDNFCGLSLRDTDFCV